MEHLPNKEFDISFISLTVVNYLDIDCLYTDSVFEDHARFNEIEIQLNHKINFLLTVIKTYMHIKANKIGSKISDEERGVYIRHTHKKLVHISGQ